MLPEFHQHGVHDGHHHGRGRRVAQPHGEKCRRQHEAEHQPAGSRDHSVGFISLGNLRKLSSHDRTEVEVLSEK